MRSYFNYKGLFGLSYTCFLWWWMMRNCFCSVIDRWKAFSLTSSQDHCQRSSPLQISNNPQAGFEYAQNLISGFVEWNCAVLITTTPRYWGNLGKLDPNIPNYAKRHTKSNPKTSAPHWTSNEVLLLCQGYLSVQLYLSCGYSSIRGIWENRVQIPQKSNELIHEK